MISIPLPESTAASARARTPNCPRAPTISSTNCWTYANYRSSSEQRIWTLARIRWWTRSIETGFRFSISPTSAVRNIRRTRSSSWLLTRATSDAARAKLTPLWPFVLIAWTRLGVAVAIFKHWPIWTMSNEDGCIVVEWTRATSRLATWSTWNCARTPGVPWE